MSTQLRKPRNGNIDLIRILATFLILIGHFVPKFLWNGNEHFAATWKRVSLPWIPTVRL